MRTKLNLAIAVGLLLVVFTCQKEEVSVIDSTQGTELSKDHVVITSDTAVDVLSNENEGTATTIIAPDHIVVNNIIDIDMKSEDFEIPSISWSTVEEWSEFVVTEENKEELLANVTIDWSDTLPTGDQWIFADTKIGSSEKADEGEGPTPDCPYEDCDVAIPATAAYYQPIADALCQDVWVCIACCIDDDIVYALLIIRHNCGIIDPNPPAKF